MPNIYRRDTFCPVTGWRVRHSMQLLLFAAIQGAFCVLQASFALARLQRRRFCNGLLPPGTLWKAVVQQRAPLEDRHGVSRVCYGEFFSSATARSSRTRMLGRVVPKPA
jgi:hypothetical protein